MEWNFKVSAEQPIQGARIYSLQHILHNLPDLEAVALLQKISRAMAPTSRLLIIEYAKNMTYTSLHASMIALYGGRERSASEWRQLASVSGLRVTFEQYVRAGGVFSGDASGGLAWFSDVHSISRSSID
jgi:O-methyltransferase.